MNIVKAAMSAEALADIGERAQKPNTQHTQGDIMSLLAHIALLTEERDHYRAAYLAEQGTREYVERGLLQKEAHIAAQDAGYKRLHWAARRLLDCFAGVHIRNPDTCTIGQHVDELRQAMLFIKYGSVGPHPTQDRQGVESE